MKLTAGRQIRAYITLQPDRLPSALWLILGAFAFFLVSTRGTGLATDDFVHLDNALRQSWRDALLPSAYISVPVLHYTHAIAYFVLGDTLWAYSILKATYLTFASAALFSFLKLHLSRERALLGAAIFVMSPLHDGATLWLTGQYLILSLASFLFAYVAAQANKLGAAAGWTTLGSFSSYGSPPLAAGLAILLLWRRQWRPAFALLLPNAIYVAYYTYTSMRLRAGTARLPEQFDLIKLVKSYAVQIGSLADALIGPAALLKIAFSITAISVYSLTIALGVAWIARKFGHPVDRPPVNAPLIVSAGAILTLALGIFAITGAYPQVAFNLGDRVLIYGVLFMTVLLASVANGRLLGAIALCSLIAFMGLSDHWRDWNRQVQASIRHIGANAGLSGLRPEEQLFVSGLQFSALGPFSHIDHFTSNYVIREVFALARQGKPRLEPLGFNRRLRLEVDSLVDIKYGTRTPIADSILLYDAESDTLSRIAKADIAAKIKTLPPEIRHWTQWLGNGQLQAAILWLMPNLRYAYPS